MKFHNILMACGSQAAGGAVLPADLASGNYILKPYEFDDPYWTTTTLAIAANTSADPMGGTAADRLTPATAASFNSIAPTEVAPPNVPVVLRYRIKPNGYTKVGIREGRVSGDYATFLLSGAGSVIDQGGGVGSISLLPSGFYLLSLTHTVGFNLCRPDFYIMDDLYLTGSPHLYAYNPDSVSGVYAWGASVVVA